MEAEKRVLVVEDQAPLRRSLETFLGWAGYAYDSCSTAREAIVLAERLVAFGRCVLYVLDAGYCLERWQRVCPNDSSNTGRCLRSRNRAWIGCSRVGEESVFPKAAGPRSATG